MMAQNDRVVVGIDVAKDKVDACIRALSSGRTFPSTSEGRRATAPLWVGQIADITDLGLASSIFRKNRNSG